MVKHAKKICHTAPVPNNVHVSKDSQYIYRITALTNECGKNSRQQNDIHLHKKRCHGAQRTRRTHQNERETYPDRSPRQPWLVPHSTNSTTWAMATTKTIKESLACIRASKQRIRFTINGTGCEMDARGMRIPSKFNMAKGNKSRKLCWMVNPHQTQRQQILPRHKQMPKGDVNQTCKNVRSTKQAPLESFVNAEMKGKKIRDV